MHHYSFHFQSVSPDDLFIIPNDFASAGLNTQLHFHFNEELPVPQFTIFYTTPVSRESIVNGAGV